MASRSAHASFGPGPESTTTAASSRQDHHRVRDVVGDPARDRAVDALGHLLEAKLRPGTAIWSGRPCAISVGPATDWAGRCRRLGTGVHVDWRMPQRRARTRRIGHPGSHASTIFSRGGRRLSIRAAPLRHSRRWGSPGDCRAAAPPAVPHGAAQSRAAQRRVSCSAGAKRGRMSTGTSFSRSSTRSVSGRLTAIFSSSAAAPA